MNVYHGCGSNLEFDNNIVWHTETAAQDVLWGDDCQVKHGEAKNNLIVEHGAVDTYSLVDRQRARFVGRDVLE